MYVSGDARVSPTIESGNQPTLFRDMPEATGTEPGTSFRGLHENRTAQHPNQDASRGNRTERAAREARPDVSGGNDHRGTFPLLENQVLPKLDFDSTAQTVLERIMQDEDYTQLLAQAKTRTSLRNPSAWAVERSIRNHEKDEPEQFHRYFHEQDFRN